MSEPGIFKGIVYRAVNPRFQHAPLSGEGARLYGGRLNKKGTAALYTSLHQLTAIKEANQVGYLQPTTLIAYDIMAEPVLDIRNDKKLMAIVAQNDWREQMRHNGASQSQKLAEELSKNGIAGVLVPSFALTADAGDVNLILWQWMHNTKNSMAVIDDEGRL